MHEQVSKYVPEVNMDDPQGDGKQPEDKRSEEGRNDIRKKFKEIPWDISTDNI